MCEKGVFHFRQFSIRHDKSTMKVGTDGVLLGAWVDVWGAECILDVGTGSGVIALMLAQRTGDDVQIDGIDIAEADAAQASENVASTAWRSRVGIYHSALQSFRPAKQYDLIVSNPPYFTNDLKPPRADRETARHTSTLSHKALLAHSRTLLVPTGRLSVILPSREGQQFIMLAGNFGFYCRRRAGFRTRKEKPVTRLLLEFSRHPTDTIEEEIILYQENDVHSPAYRALTEGFYLGR